MEVGLGNCGLCTPFNCAFIVVFAKKDTSVSIEVSANYELKHRILSVFKQLKECGPNPFHREPEHSIKTSLRLPELLTVALNILKYIIYTCI